MVDQNTLSVNLEPYGEVTRNDYYFGIRVLWLNIQNFNLIPFLSESLVKIPSLIKSQHYGYGKGRVGDKEDRQFNFQDVCAHLWLQICYFEFFTMDLCNIIFIACACLHVDACLIGK